MFIYYIVLILVMTWTIVENKVANRKSFFFVLFTLCTFATARSNLVGTDSLVYTKDFLVNIDPKTLIFDPNIEYGYQFMSILIRNYTNQYYWLFFVSSLIILVLTLNTIRKYSIDYPMSIFIYLTFGFYTFFFNVLRQGISIAICFFGIRFLLDKKFLKYFIIIFIASLFHVSAWIMIPFYFFVHWRLKLEYKLLIVFLASLAVSGIAVSYLAQSNQRYQNYGEQADNAGGYLLILFYSMIGLVLYFFGKKIRLSNEFYNILEQIFLCGLLFVFPIIFLGTDPAGPQRILYNFSIYLVFLIPILINYRFNLIEYKLLFSVLAVIYFTLITQRLYGINPYIINDFFRIF